MRRWTNISLNLPLRASLKASYTAVIDSDGPRQQNRDKFGLHGQKRTCICCRRFESPYPSCPPSSRPLRLSPGPLTAAIPFTLSMQGSAEGSQPRKISRKIRKILEEALARETVMGRDLEWHDAAAELD